MRQASIHKAVVMLTGARLYLHSLPAIFTFLAYINTAVPIYPDIEISHRLLELGVVVKNGEKACGLHEKCSKKLCV